MTIPLSLANDTAVITVEEPAASAAGGQGPSADYKPKMGDARSTHPLYLVVGRSAVATAMRCDKGTLTAECDNQRGPLVWITPGSWSQYWGLSCGQRGGAASRGATRRAEDFVHNRA
jgi:hypothetical protein